MVDWLRLAVIGLAVSSLGASHQTPNFSIQAPTVAIAKRVGEVAEASRQDLAVLWFGHTLPKWSARCSVTVVVGENLGAGGSTKFRFDDGHVFGWRMRVQGSLERILDSVIPHEVNHTILACYFRRPVPRWADEGAASLMEHESEQQHQINLVNRLMHEGRRIPLRMLFNIAEYPRDMKQVMALYAEGYSLTEYLIQLGGRKKFLRFLDDAHHRSWDAAVESFYQTASIEKLEADWSRWVLAGSPSLDETPEPLLAAGTRRQPSTRSGIVRTSGTAEPGGVVRSQTPESPPRSLAATVAPTRTPGIARILRTRSGSTQVRAPSPFEAVRPASAQIRSARNEIVVPLTLTPIAKRQPTSRPFDLTMPERFSVPTVSEESAFGNRFQETHIRVRAQPKPAVSRGGSWTQFPGKAR